MASKTATAEKVARVGQRRQVVIPREMLDTLNIHEEAKRLADFDTTLTPQEAKMVRRGMKQIKDGRFKLWRDVKHAS
jgi:bifunctional DNA-binding transcriptional regulator/antitoxin component of YhaV-PrlF toxin-antitoxin module